jgi:hypothetical protein
MDNLYDIILFLHVMSFVFMSVPLFNLISGMERQDALFFKQAFLLPAFCF